MQNDQTRIAFELLYAENATPVYRFALRLCGNREDAEDLTVEAFDHAFRNLSLHRGESAQRTWLFAIVVNRWKMLRRKRKVRTDNLDGLAEVAASFRFKDFELVEAISELPDKQREAFLLVKGEGFSHAEAAKVLRVPVGTVYFRVHSAVHQLRAKLGPSRSEEPVKEAPCKP